MLDTAHGRPFGVRVATPDPSRVRRPLFPPAVGGHQKLPVDGQEDDSLHDDSK